MRELRELLRVGVAYSLKPPEWLRGPAVLDGDLIVLEERARDVYQPHPHSKELLEGIVNVRETSDALRFVRTFGLLRHGPYASAHAEPFGDWLLAAMWLRQTLLLYIGL